MFSCAAHACDSLLKNVIPWGSNILNFKVCTLCGNYEYYVNNANNITKNKIKKNKKKIDFKKFNIS